MTYCCILCKVGSMKTEQCYSLPKYSAGEETVNSLSHLVGAIFGFGALIFFINYQIKFDESLISMMGYYIYSFFMIFMFSVSAIYHSRPFNSKSKAIWRVIDHIDIYFFISATYTPICLYAFNNVTLGYTVLIVNWSLALLAGALNAISLTNKVIKTISMIAYVFNGWMIIFVNPLANGILQSTYTFLLLGGFSFTIGAILYGIGSKKKWFHSIFHFFVLLGVIFQFVAVLTIL